MNNFFYQTLLFPAPAGERKIRKIYFCQMPHRPGKNRRETSEHRVNCNPFAPDK